MNTVKLKVYAKINLTLDITGVQDGYHLLDSLVCNVDLSDSITLKKRKDKLVNVYMRGMGSEHIPPEKNNAVKAGEAFVNRFSTTGADIMITKDIPMGGGLGGSSADAAGVLRGMAKLYNLENEYDALKEIADSLGSDTGYMLSGGLARLTGRGEKVEFLKSDKQLWFLLIMPKTPVSTPLCYKTYDILNKEDKRRTQNAIEAYCSGDMSALGQNLYNALAIPAQTLNGDVKKALEEGKDFSPLGCSMTGSGSCVFVLFENREFCEWAESRYKGKFKTKVVKTVDCGKEKILYSPFALTEEEKKLAEE